MAFALREQNFPAFRRITTINPLFARPRGESLGGTLPPVAPFRIQAYENIKAIALCITFPNAGRSRSISHWQPQKSRSIPFFADRPYHITMNGY
jgi:hypothetical protein